MPTGHRSDQPPQRNHIRRLHRSAADCCGHRTSPLIGYTSRSSRSAPAPAPEGVRPSWPRPRPRAADRACKPPARAPESAASRPRRVRFFIAEQPTSRPCSADESVAPTCRCQQAAARSFHGLCSPPRFLLSLAAPRPPSRCRQHTRGCTARPASQSAAPPVSPKADGRSRGAM